MPSIVYVNGKLIPEREALISIYDRSYLYGEGVFETMRAYNGKIAFADLHYHRMRENCKALKIDLPLDEYAFEKALTKTLKLNNLRDAYVRAIVSPIGVSIGITRPAVMQTNTVIFCKPFAGRPASIYKHGAKVIMIETVANEPEKLASIKSTSYLTRMLGRLEVQTKRADEGLFKNSSGFITEGTASNLFIVKDGVLITPPPSDGLLPGITRKIVISLAEGENMAFREDHITLDDIMSSDEIFMTGSTTEILPVREVVGITTKKEVPGKVSRRLMEAYRNLLP